MDFSEKWGQSIEEATNLALQDLKLSIDEVEVTVLEEPSKGFLGLGAKLAKVRVERKQKPAQEKKVEHVEKPVKVAVEEKHVQPETKSERKPAERSNERSNDRKYNERNNDRRYDNRRKNDRNDRSARPRHEKPVPQNRPADLQPIEDHVAITFLSEVIANMGLNLNVKATINEECIYLDIEGRDSGTLIGKRGQTLDSIQYLTSLVVNKNKEKYMRVVVDAENYRAKREKTLEQLANRLADKVVRTKKSVRLEPMNPYERKVIHSTLQSNTSVTTRSEGEEPYRRIIIELTK